MDLSKLTPAPWMAVRYETLSEAQHDGGFVWARHPMGPIADGPIGSVFQGDEGSYTGLPGSVECGIDNAEFIALARNAFDGDPEALAWWEANRSKRL